MKYVICSDIHGNIIALKNLLCTLNNDSIHGIIFCGDLMGYYYHANDVLTQFQNIPNILSIKGNHDVNYLEAIKDNAVRENFIVKYGQAYAFPLDEKNKIYLSKLPDCLSVTIEGKHVGIFHGTPDNIFNGRLYPDTPITKEQIELFDEYDIVFLGHTHYRMKRISRHTLIINPGSLGQPRDGNGFSYCIFDFQDNACIFKTVDCNLNIINNAIQQFETIEHHRHYLKSVLQRNTKE